MLSYLGFMGSERYVYTFILDCPSILVGVTLILCRKEGKMEKLRGDRCKLVIGKGLRHIHTLPTELTAGTCGVEMTRTR